MTRDPFDEIIKSKLEKFEANTSNESVWDLFERYRESHTDIVDKKDLDTDIKQTIKHHTVPFNLQHWQQMEKQIELFETRKKYIYSSKMIELTLCALILMLFVQYPGALIKKTTSDTLPIAYNEVPYEINHNSQSDVINLPISDIVKDQNVIAKININKTEPTNNKIKYLQSNSSIDSDNTEFQLIVSKHPDYMSTDSRIDVKKMDQSDEKKLVNALSTSEYFKNEKFLNINVSKDITGVTVIPTRVNIEMLSENALIMPKKELFTSKKHPLFLTVYSSVDANLINTPFDKVYSKASYYKEAINSSYGIGIFKQLEHVTAGLGLAYAKRNYNPETIEEIYGVRENLYSQVTFNRISFDIISLPLQLQYRFIEKPNWRVFLMVSASANLVINADYGIKDVVVAGRPAIDYNRSESESRLEEKPFIKGLLHGDNIADDYFLSGGIGFGIEMDIIKNTALYLQPSYQRQILSKDIGIGPNKDQIHTSSIQIGLKFGL